MTVGGRHGFFNQASVSFVSPTRLPEPLTSVALDQHGWRLLARLGMNQLFAGSFIWYAIYASRHACCRSFRERYGSFRNCTTSRERLLDRLTPLPSVISAGRPSISVSALRKHQYGWRLGGRSSHTQASGVRGVAMRFDFCFPANERTRFNVRFVGCVPSCCYEHCTLYRC